MSQILVRPSVRNDPRNYAGLGAARIFWKELRAQRAFWLGLCGLAIGLEFLLFVVLPGRLWNRGDAVTQLRVHQWLVTVLGCSFAAGSAAIAFAGEVESKTKGLLQRIPARARDLAAGKLAFALVGSYALLIVLWPAGLCLMQIWGTAPFSQVDSRDMSYQFNVFWPYASMPAFFVVIGGLFSLLLSDVLLTVLLAGVSTAALLAVPTIRDDLPLQAAVIAAVGLCDFFLARHWLHDAGAVEWTALRRLLPRHISLRPRRRVAEQATPLETRRSGVAWRRAAGSLIWKEFRQAFPFCLALLVAGLVALLFIPLADTFDRTRGSDILSLVFIVIAPLLPGIAAIRAERRAGAFRLLANRGVAPDGFLICKHLVWLSLSLSLFAILVVIDLNFLARNGDFQRTRTASLWDLVAGVANVTFQSPHTSVIVPLAVAAFHVVLLYSLGFLLGLLLTGPITAFFAGSILWLPLAFCWVAVAGLRIPFWWTVGLFPILFLAVAWVRTADWLIGRNTLPARVKAAAVFVVPFAGIVGATAVYRVTEIPAVVVPKAVLDPGRTTGAPAASGPQSLFIDAMNALQGGPEAPLAPPDRTVLSDGWQAATPADRRWVEQNARARKLSVEAAQHKPAAFPLQAGSHFGESELRFINERRLWWLAQLLLYSARKLEFEDRLDDALGCYVAVARLGSDAERSDWLPPFVFRRNYPVNALQWMQRWAQHPKQSTERIKKAIRDFEQIPPPTAQLIADLLRNWKLERRLLRADVRGHLQNGEEYRAVSDFRRAYWFFPWEIVRLERLVDAIFVADLNEFEQVEDELRNQGFVTMTSERAVGRDRMTAAPWKYLQTTLVPPDLVQIGYSSPQPSVNQLAEERMNLIALAIADFERAQHKRPESLRALVPTYFQRLPADPWTGGDFHYEPQGLQSEIALATGKLQPGTPFLASAGMLDSRFVRQFAPNKRQPSYEIISRFAAPGNFGPVAGSIFPAPLVRLP